MPYQVVIILVIGGILAVGGLILVFALVFRNSRIYHSFIEKAGKIKEGMPAEDVFQIMNCKATSIEEDGDKVIVIWKDNIWRIGSVISRSLKVVIGSDERVMRVVKENLGD